MTGVPNREITPESAASPGGHTVAHLAGESRPAPVWRRAEVLVAAAAVICFANVLPNDFCDDGVPIVAQNDKVSEPGQWLAIWTTDYWSEARDATPYRDLLYRPVALTSYRLVRIVAGVSAFPHHVVNILLHALVSVMVVRLCRHLGGPEVAALTAGLLFAVLPIHTAVLNNVVGRADLLVTAGVVVALLAHRRLMLAIGRPLTWTTAKWGVVAAFAAFVAMASKENGVGVVALVPLLDVLLHRSSCRAGTSARWLSARTLARLSYLVVPTAVYFALRYHALAGHLYQRPALSKTINVLVDAPWWQQGLGVVQLWGMYWEKTLWPEVLCVNYSINAVRLATGLLDWHVIFGVLVTVVLVVASVTAWRRGMPGVAFVFIALIIAYAPTANALMLIQVFFAERIWYLPSVWVALLLGTAVAPLMRRPALCILGVLVVLCMITRCWIRNSEWHNNGTLYAAAYRDHPNAIGAAYLFGHWLVTDGDGREDLEDGIGLLNRAIEIDLGFTDGHRALAVAYLKANNYKAALKHLRIADMQVPGHPPTVETLAQVSAMLSAGDEQLAHLMRQVEKAPHDVGAETALVRKLRELGRAREALERFRAHEHEFGDNVAWQTEYAVTLVYLNERDEAIERYRRCLELDPAEPQLLVESAMLLLERREEDDLDEAWRLAGRAAELAPGAPSVLICRAELLALRGDLTEAGALYQKAIGSLPPGSELRRKLEARAKTLGQ